MRHFSALMFLLISATAAPVFGQCRGIDAFADAFQATDSVDHVKFINDQFNKDLNLLSAGYHRHELDRPRFRGFAGPIAEATSFVGLPVCTTNGIKTAPLSTTTIGGVFGFDFVSKNSEPSVSVRYTLSEQFLSLENDILPGQVDVPDRRFGVGVSQSTHAGRIQITRWAAIAFGSVSREPTKNLTAFDDTTLTSEKEIPSSQFNFVTLQSPELRSEIALVANETDEIETIHFDFRRLPVHKNFEVSARVAHHRREQQTYAVLGSNFVDGNAIDEAYRHDENEIRTLGNRVLRTGLEIAPEFRPVNIRFVRARAEAEWVAHSLTIDPIATLLHGVPYVAFGAHANTSLYRSRSLTEQTGVSNAFGVSGGFFAGLGIRAMSIYLDAHLGVNNPESLTTSAALVHRPELGIQIRWRAGF